MYGLRYKQHQQHQEQHQEQQPQQQDQPNLSLQNPLVESNQHRQTLTQTQAKLSI
jgi:hypothetical protein